MGTKDEPPNWEVGNWFETETTRVSKRWISKTVPKVGTRAGAEGHRAELRAVYGKLIHGEDPSLGQITNLEFLNSNGLPTEGRGL